MAGVTVVCVSVAEPKCHSAAESALEVNKLVAVFVAILDSCTYRFGRALRTHKFFDFKILNGVLSVAAVNHSSEVRILALETLIVGQFEQCKLCQLPVVVVLGIRKTWIFLKFFEFRAFQSLLFDACLDFKSLVKEALENRTMLAVDLLLACRTVEEVECNSRCHPLFLE